MTTSKGLPHVQMNDMEDKDKSSQIKKRPENKYKFESVEIDVMY